VSDDELAREDSGGRRADSRPAGGSSEGVAGAAGEASIALVTERDLADLLGLMRAYCDFYDVHPPDRALQDLAVVLIGDPEREGLQLIARRPGGEAVGFATLFWSWSTARAARLGVMNDLYVAPEARGQGLGQRLVEACLQRCSERGVAAMEWETALDNDRAQSVYDGLGAARERWLSYSLELPGA
jgi:ribosomal protein S18 acetylase RimI-like enzyme